MSKPKNWLDAMLPFPRPEYVKQTELLLTDLLWRSPGSSLGTLNLIDELPKLAKEGEPEPQRLVPRKLYGKVAKVCETLPIATTIELSSRVAVPAELKSPIGPLLESLNAPRAQGNNSLSCVPIHPAVISLQTLHGLVNKGSPANLAMAIETMGWLGGAIREGAVAAMFLDCFKSAATPRKGATGAIEWLLQEIASHTWAGIPRKYGHDESTWVAWPAVLPSAEVARPASHLSGHARTPFGWFLRKWRNLCGPESKWHDQLPARRFADWAMCLLRTGLAFSYLWEAEFYCRLHERIAARGGIAAGGVNRLESLLSEGVSLATVEPLSVPASQKGMWPATAELIARGSRARDLVFKQLDGDTTRPPGSSLLEILEGWISSVPVEEARAIGAPLQTDARTAPNQKEFVKYLLLPRSSNKDLVDEADFYYLAQNNSRHTWFRPGPEWLVVVAGLLRSAPGGQCTLGELGEDLECLGMRVERSVLVALLEEAGLSTDSPDADDALIIRSGF